MHTGPSRRALRVIQRAIASLCVAAIGAASPASAQSRPEGQLDAYVTTGAYVVTFYPLWFTYYQSRVASVNRLVGPDRISSLYQIVVAINDDTLYASTFVDVTEPVVLSVPASAGAYSVLTLDPYGNVFESGIPSQPPDAALPAATYTLTGPGYAGTVAQGSTRIAMPTTHSILIFRADKYSPSGQDQRVHAQDFRASLATQPLCAHEGRPCPADTPPGGKSLILPQIAFAAPFKTIADTLIAGDAIEFLRQLQVAVKSSFAPPLSADEAQLAARFDTLFGNGDFASRFERALFVAGAQSAHELILERYHQNRGPTGWVHFTNMGAWGDAVIDRASITEFIQYGNTSKTAAYYHTFHDSRGRALDGGRGATYTLTFAASELPQASRFWSVTAYTPESVELVANDDHKYVVASYTPGLVYNADGSLTIHFAMEQPKGVPFANWLPIPRRNFNAMLRVYGPEGSVANNQYVPPAIEKTR
jgi:hypothetical protein